LIARERARPAEPGICGEITLCADCAAGARFYLAQVFPQAPHRRMQRGAVNGKVPFFFKE